MQRNNLIDVMLLALPDSLIFLISNFNPSISIREREDIFEMIVD